MDDSKLAHVIWQAAKFLIALLEKEYNLESRKDKRDGQR